MLEDALQGCRRVAHEFFVARLDVARRSACPEPGDGIIQPSAPGLKKRLSACHQGDDHVAPVSDHMDQGKVRKQLRESRKVVHVGGAFLHEEARAVEGTQVIRETFVKLAEAVAAIYPLVEPLLIDPKRFAWR